MASASSRKKRKEVIIEEDSDEELSSEVESDDSGTDIAPELEVQVEFEARSPHVSDFHGIKRLLLQLLLKSSVNVSEITDLILNQSKVGSVLKCVGDDDDEDSDDSVGETYGIITVLNLNCHKDVSGIRDFLQLVTVRCPDEQILKVLQDKENKIGWLISERFINIPAHIAPPLYASLRSEITKASKKGKSFDFDYLLYVCKSYKMDVSIMKKKKKKSVQSHGQPEETQDIMFINAEDEILHSKAVAKYHYDVTEESDVLVTGKWREDDYQMKSFRTVMLIPFKEMEKITSEMEQFAV